MSLTSVQSLLGDSVSRHKMDKKLESSKILSVFSEVKEVFFAQEIASAIHPVDFKEGILRVACLEDSLVPHLKVSENTLINILNTELGEISVVGMDYIT